MKKSEFLRVGIASLALTIFSNAAITGVVWEDLPVAGDTKAVYGKKEASELGLAGIKVNAYNIYLCKLEAAGEITPSEAGMAAIEYEIEGRKVY